MPETYNEESVQQILKIAMSRQGQPSALTRSQLQEIADELGISEDNLMAAEQDWDLQKQERDARQAFDDYRHQQLRQNFVRCLVVSAFLLLSNLVVNHAINWSTYPVMGWLFLLSLQAWRTYQQEGEEYDRAFRRWKLGQQIGQSFRALTERFRHASTPLKTGGNNGSSNSSN
ncbi:MAG: 2TM domain-containing protein [Cyanobacteria bacterium P01_F01_bin.150]